MNVTTVASFEIVVIASQSLRARRALRATAPNPARCPQAAAWRKALVDGDEVNVCIGKRDGDRHLAAQRGVLRLELVHFDDLLVRNEPHEATVVRVGLRRRLAGPVGASYVSEIRSAPSSRAANSWTRQVIPVGTFHLALQGDREVHDRRLRGAP
jgi:hypothetical protein